MFAIHIEACVLKPCYSTFVLRTNCIPPSELVSFIRLLSMTADEWEKTKTKTKIPKAKADVEILSCIAEVLEARLAEYATTIEVRTYRLEVRTILTEIPADRRNPFGAIEC